MIIYYIIIIIIVILILLLLIYYNINNEINNEFTNENVTIEMVIARYNENLDWLEQEPFNSYNSIVYNKGINDTFNKHNVKNIIQLKNVGRCDHTYLYHIINNYDNLTDLTIFLPGSLPDKIHKANLIFNKLKTHKNTIFNASYYNNVKDDMYNFQLNLWKASNINNNVLNPEQDLELSPIRPFGKWFENKFGNLVIHYISYQALMCISKTHILQNSKDHYINLIKELENSSNPEVGHYIERSWEAIFYPLTNAIIC